MLASLADRWQDRPARPERSDIGPQLEGETFLPGQTLIDPPFEPVDFPGGEAVSLGRHALVGVVRGDAFEDLAVAALAGHDGFGVQDGLARVERERTLVLAVGVALGTARLDQGDDLVCEVDLVRGLRLGGWRHGQEDETGQEHRQAEHRPEGTRRGAVEEDREGHGGFHGVASRWVSAKRIALLDRTAGSLIRKRFFAQSPFGQPLAA